MVAATPSPIPEPPMPPTMKPTTKFRAMLSEPGIVMLPAVGDPFAARIVAREGFSVVMSSGNATSAMRLGMPDIGLMTLSENAENAGRIAEASGLPVFADADTGYGNALNVRRTIREFERQGVAAVMIEDQVTPKKCGMLAGKQVIPAAEMEMKVKAALDARRDDDLVVIARTDARAVEGLDAAIARAVRYVKAGADCIFVEGPRTREEAQAIAKRIAVPMVYNVTPSGSVPPLEKAVLAAMGYRILSFSIYVLLSGIPAIRTFLREVKDGNVAHAGRDAATMQEYYEILGYESWRRYEDQYAVPPEPPVGPART